MLRRLVPRSAFIASAALALMTVAAVPALAAPRSSPVGSGSQFVQVSPNLWVARTGTAVTYRSLIPGVGTLYEGAASPGVRPPGFPVHSAASTSESSRAESSKVVSAAQVTPLNATGWSGLVYIHIYSKGTSGPLIRFWWTSTKPIHGIICTAPSFLNGRYGTHLFDHGYAMCITTPNRTTVFSATITFSPARTFNNQTLCNTWSTIPGRPCEHVS
jgi:hypothetical protein